MNQKGAIALIMVIMVTTLTIVSSVIISLVNINDLLAKYHLSESSIVVVDIDACINDALWRIGQDNTITGSYSITESVNCSYTISETLNDIKTINGTATTNSDLGSWTRSVEVEIDISNQPIKIVSYKDIIL